MADFVLRVGSRSAQGVRPNNEDRVHVDLGRKLFIVADGMGGQERGEIASGLAVDIIPKVLNDRLAADEAAGAAVAHAFATANTAIIEAGRGQPEGRRMGTTAVCALHRDGKVFIAGLGDSRAYLIRGNQVDQLTLDHSVAQALVACGAISAEEARTSPYQHVLHKFLGCVNMHDGTEVKPFSPDAGDRLVLGSDGLTNHITEDDLRQGARKYTDPQEWADRLVDTALTRGSRDNVSCIVVVFDPS
jgi:serine/threonine protein phosphatase PrpC